MRKVNVTTKVMDMPTCGNLQVLGVTMLVLKDWGFEGTPTIPPKLDCSFTAGRFNLDALSPNKISGLRVIALWHQFLVDQPRRAPTDRPDQPRSTSAP
jgi:hypothetical protein